MKNHIHSPTLSESARGALRSLAVLHGTLAAAAHRMLQHCTPGVDTSLRHRQRRQKATQRQWKDARRDGGRVVNCWHHAARAMQMRAPCVRACSLDRSCRKEASEVDESMVLCSSFIVLFDVDASRAGSVE